jgi:integrase
MASVQKKGDAYYCQFLFQGRRRTVTVGKVSADSAAAFAARTEELLGLIARGRVVLPPGTDITDFVRRDGRPLEPDPAPAALVTFRQLKDRYLETHRAGAMESNSLETARMHLGHFERTLGARFPLPSLTLADVQRHVTGRSRKQYRGRPLSPVTLRKEVASFRAAWNWGVLNGLTEGPFPSRGVVYPKADEKPPFMTLEEITGRLSPSTSDKERDELWQCLYLRPEEVGELLEHVKGRASHDWVYPLVGFAAHTGARRSEMLRALVADVDFSRKTVLIREKKRSRTQRTTRRVPLTAFLEVVLREWLTAHPGGPHLFCQGAEVARSKTRSRTTGHKGERTRPSSLGGRMATVTVRSLPGFGPVTRHEAHDHLRRTLAGSKWKVLRGYHVLRHSFISACASRGIDQRLIDEWTGHSTEEQRKRYRHLYPSTQREAISRVFD